MNTEELNALKDRAYKTAVAHGFHEEERPDVYWLGLVMSEMGEAINADRKGMHANTKGFEENEAKGLPFDENFKKHIKDTVEDEIADIVIRLLDFAGLKGYELSIITKTSFASIAIVGMFAENGLPGSLLPMIGALGDSLDDNITERTISIVFNVISDCFDKMTGGSECDLWWFVKQKMRYNEQRPMLNGKRY